MEAMLTVQQVADELGVSKSRVFQYIREGRLEAQRVGIQDLVTRAHLNAVKPGLRKTETGRPKKADEAETIEASRKPAPVKATKRHTTKAKGRKQQ